jgi:hypothetical protein
VRTVVTDSTPPAIASWWRWWRVLLALLAAAVIGCVAFAYRFNALGGALGGFDNDQFTVLMRTEMLFHGERPLRDFSDAGLSGAWPPLSYLLPKWAQEIGGRNLLSEAYLTVGILALVYALVFLIALDLSRRWSMALLATALAIATGPKLYNYSKVVTLTAGAFAIRAVALHPTTVRLFLAAAVTAIAALFRHDYAVYVGVAMTLGLLARDPRDWRATARHIALYIGFGTILLLPTAIAVQMYHGIPQYLRDGLESSQIEARRTELRWPVLHLAAPMTTDSLLALSYYLFWAVLLVAAAVMVWRLLDRGHAFPPAERATGFAVLALAGIVDLFFLRGNLGQRFGDAIVPTVLAGAWSLGAAAALRGTRARLGLQLATPLLLAVMLVAVDITSEVGREIETGALTDSWEHAHGRFDRVRAELMSLPPTDWSHVDARGTLRAARYVAECTVPEDYVLVAAYAPEVPVFARRRFAAGQPTVGLSFYTSEADQRRAIGRLQDQSVPIILAADEAYDEEFASDYPLLASYVEAHYRLAGTIDTDRDHLRFRVFVERGRQPRRADPVLGLPCFR